MAANISSETLQLLQLFFILGTGRAASAQDMRLIETSVDEFGGLTEIFAAIDSFMQDRVSQKGYAEVIRAIAKNGAGLQLSYVEVTKITGELAVAQGNGSWSELFVDLAANKGTFGAAVVGRAETAVHFTELLDSAGKSALSVDFGTGATVTGSSAHIKVAYSSLTQKASELNTVGAIRSLGNEALVATDSGSVAATALTELDALTTGVVAFTSVTGVTGTTAELTAAYAGNSAGTIRGLEDKALTVTNSGSVAATVLNELGSLTKGAVAVSSATGVSGTTAEIIALYAGNTAGTIKGLENKLLTVTDSGSVAATALTKLGSLTKGFVAVSSTTNVSGTAAEIIALYAGNTAGTIKGLENQPLTVTESGSVTVAALNELGALTTGQVVDTLAPAVVISDNTAGTANGAVTYTFTFSQAVTDFTVADVVVTGGAKAGAFAAGASGSSVYTLVVTPTANSTTNMTVDVAAGVATADGTAAANSVATQSVQVVDTLAPTVIISDNTASTANGAVTYSFTFSQAVTDFTVADVVVMGGNSAGSFASGVSGDKVYTLVVTPTANSTTNMTVDVAAGVAVDANTNPNTIAAQSVQAVNTNAPTLVITDDEGGTANIAGGAVTYTFTFSEAVSGFAVGDVTVAGGTKAGSFATGADNSSVYTLVVTPTANSNTNMTVDVAAGVATADGTAAANAVATQSDQVVDTLAPTVTSVMLVPTGGTVVANELNTTNTHLAASATLTAGEATGGSAVMKVNGITKLTDSTILAGDTSVNFTTSDGTPTNVELQAAIAAGGVVTVEVLDAAGNMTSSSVSNPTLVVDYTIASTFTYSASVSTTTGTVTTTFTGNFTGTIGVYTDSGGESLYNGVAAVAIANTTSGSVSVGPGLPTTVFVVIKDASHAIVGDVRPVILGPNAASTVNGSGASEIIFGFEGVSTINAGGGHNIIIGGAGIDTITTGNGNNVIQSGAGADLITTGSGNDIITGGAGIKTINSGAGNDNIYGGAGADVLSGGAGNDNISGSDGADTLTGGDGVDNLTGGIGADVFAWASADIDTTAGAVIDTINDYGTDADSIRGSWGVGTAGNFFNSSATPAADLATLLSAADTKLDGTFKYYVGRVGDDQYLVTDNDGIGYTDVIQLTGFTAAFAVGQIVA